MRFPSPVAIDWLGEFIGAKIIGDKKGQASGINEIHKVEPGDLVFVDHPKYYDKCIHSQQLISSLIRKLIVLQEKPYWWLMNHLKHTKKS
jgi:UDP-3-O-[3-hydroxymyristoyl] glucosamine N-acyltransferase